MRVLRYCIDNIKIVSEDITDRDKEFSAAKTLLTDAEQIYFLGFGYAPTNMHRLNIEHLAGKNEIVVGSGYGLTANEVASIIKAGKGAFSTEIDRALDCLHFVRSLVDWS